MEPLTIKVHQETLKAIEDTFPQHQQSKAQFTRTAIAEKLRAFGYRVPYAAPDRKGVGGKPTHQLTEEQAVLNEGKDAARTKPERTIKSYGSEKRTNSKPVSVRAKLLKKNAEAAASDAVPKSKR